MTSEGFGEKTEDQGGEGPSASTLFLISQNRLSTESFDIKNSPRFIIININIVGGMSWEKSWKSSNYEEHGEGTFSKLWGFLSDITRKMRIKRKKTSETNQ